MTFDQSSWQLHNSRVYNISGDLHLTEQSGPAEFVAAVEEMRARVRALDNVDAPDIAAVDAELAEVAALGDGDPDTAVDDPEDSTRSGRAVRGLARVGALLRGLTGAATAAGELGASVDELAQWAGHHL
ncbi:hypothetical protein [Streptomyces griseosporeus]|uniref:hypothetical protein n=1 Tax=Streptomyces griseosporeus TaxID=1910 RepID=UPI0036F694A9